MASRFSTITTVAAVVGLALGAAVLGVLLARPQATVAATTGIPARQITVIGNGKVNAAPDTAQVQMGVRTQAPTAQEALQQNTTQVSALLAQLKQAGIADQDMQTSSVNIWARSNESGTVVQGYEVTNSVTVTIRNIAQTGGLLDQVVAAGANNIEGISFTIDDPSAQQGTARTTALADARTRAESMAQAVGGTVGQVVSVNENIGATPPLPFAEGYAGGGASTASVAVPVQPGQQTITAQVQVTFELR